MPRDFLVVCSEHNLGAIKKKLVRGGSVTQSNIHLQHTKCLLRVFVWNSLTLSDQWLIEVFTLMISILLTYNHTAFLFASKTVSLMDFTCPSSKSGACYLRFKMWLISSLEEISGQLGKFSYASTNTSMIYNTGISKTLWMVAFVMMIRNNSVLVVGCLICLTKKVTSKKIVKTQKDLNIIRMQPCPKCS